MTKQSLEPVEVGKTYRFDYPEQFKTMPEYTARRGSLVTVIRPLTADEAEPPCPEEGITQMYLVRAEDGWEGHAWEEELSEVDGK